MGLADLSRLVGLNKTTTYRLLTALESEGMVARNPETEAYRLGPEIITLGGRAMRANDLRLVSRAELERLASSFGIGIIHLDPSDIDSSVILYPARARESLDWEMINKLCEQNPDFEKFLQDVKIDIEGKRIHRSEYDQIEQDINGYIRRHLGIEPAE